VSFLIPGLPESSAHFKSVTGLDVTAGTKGGHAEGGEPRFNHNLTDTASYGPLTLSRGVTNDVDLWAWCTATFNTMHTVPVNLVVSLLGDDHQPVMNWFVVGAIPHTWKTSGLDAGKTEVLIETFTLNYQYFIRI
jgi:phage tail-like protein